MILTKDRNPRFVTIRRGGTLTNADHQLPALWAALCAVHVLDLCESARPEDLRHIVSASSFATSLVPKSGCATLETPPQMVDLLPFDI
jgi:hypothetical protein